MLFSKSVEFILIFGRKKNNIGIFCTLSNSKLLELSRLKLPHHPSTPLHSEQQSSPARMKLKSN